jgi:exosortase
MMSQAKTSTNAESIFKASATRLKIFLQTHMKKPPNASLVLKASLILISTLALFSQDLIIIFTDAVESETTSYLLIVPFLLVYLVYRKRKMVKAAIPLESSKLFQKIPLSEITGILLFLASFLLYWYGSYTFTPLEYRMLTLPIYVSACILILFNTQTLRQLLFPVVFLFLLVPPPAEILYNAGAYLSSLSSELAYNLLKLMTLPVTLGFEDGTPIIYMTQQNGTEIPLAVDVACSGIYSLIGFLVFALFTAYVIRDKVWKKALIFLAGFPLIYLLNVFRITVIGVIAHYYGETLALNVFHLLGGWVLIFIGTLILLVTSEKLFKIQVIDRQREKCTSCSSSPPTTDFCFSCGKILKKTDIKIRKRDLAKLAGLILSVILILSIQTPVFALTQLPQGSEIILQTPKGGNVTTSILPHGDVTPEYTLRFLRRDTAFEKRAKQDASLEYEYYPKPQYGETLESVYVAVEVASTRSSLHRWETCLITWPMSHGRQPTAIQIELKDVQLVENPPIIGRFFIFNNTEYNDIQAVLYWYETSVFRVNETSQQKHVKISLVAYPDTLDDVPAVKVQLLELATKVSSYWLPIKTWSQVALLISQSGDKLIIITAVFLATLYVFHQFEKRKGKRQNTTAYNKLSEPNKQIIEAVHQTEKATMPTLNNISTTYESATGKTMDKDKLLQKLAEAEKIGILKSETANKYDEPLQTWRTNMHTPRTWLWQNRKLSLPRLRAKAKK